MSEQEPAKEQTFEEALRELEALSAAVEKGDIGVEQAVEAYEKGMNLYRRCERILADAEDKIQKLQLAKDGSLEVRAMEKGDEKEARDPDR